MLVFHWRWEEIYLKMFNMFQLIPDGIRCNRQEWYVNVVSLTILALSPIWWQSTINNSVINKGCHVQIFCLVMLIRMIGTALALTVATHLLTLMLRCRLWCSACSTRYVILDGTLVVCPWTVMTEFLGIQTGFFFDPIVTCPIHSFSVLKFHQSFSDRSSSSLGIEIV